MILLFGLTELARALTSEVDPVVSDNDSPPPDCATDWCSHYNDQDEAQCESQLSSAETAGDFNCTMDFYPANCETQPNTGCRVQSGESTCIIECGGGITLGNRGLTGRELALKIWTEFLDTLSWSEECELAEVITTQRNDFCRDMERAGYRACHVDDCWDNVSASASAWADWCEETFPGPPPGDTCN